MTVLQGTEVTRARLLDEFRSGRYDAIHYAGHAFFDAASPSSSGILCAGGRVLSGADLASLEALPALEHALGHETLHVRQEAALALGHYAAARKMIDAGAVVALATDLNPGSAPCPSMPPRLMP